MLYTNSGTPQAAFERMRGSADKLIPNTQGIFKNTAEFFRRAPRASDTRFSATKRSLATMSGQPSWHRPDMLGWLNSPART
jgi:hypothetical protein